MIKKRRKNPNWKNPNPTFSYEQFVIKFWEKVIKTETCWEWTGTITPQGYGYVSFNQKMVSAHRVAFELEIGKIPDDMYVLHSCDNRKCVNPEHLRAGTAQDNVDDMKERNRSPDRRGEANGRTILSEKDILDIRSSQLKTSELMIKYNLGRTAIRDIVNKRSWKHL